MIINGKSTLANEFAYDGCHKIYLIESESDRIEAEKRGYNILPICELVETYHNSCDLRFISNWQLTKDFVKQSYHADFEI